MSARNNKIVKPFCKVCFAAGKPESEYTSHFVRSSTGSDSKVICPTLLNLNCRYCGEGGHTVKFCKVLEAKKAPEKPKRVEEVKHVTEKKSANVFSCFYEDEDEEQDEEQEEQENNIPVITNNVISYAAMAAREKPPTIVKVVEEPKLVQLESRMKSYEKLTKKSWADWSDSDDDLDDEDYLVVVSKPAPWAKK